jgi:hypothetical protein
MPGETALSTAGVPSGLESPRAIVVRNPPMAGPKPTQAMSTSMLWRSGSGVEMLAPFSFDKVASVPPEMAWAP